METNTQRVYNVRHSGLGRGWFVMSVAAHDRYDIRTEHGPYTTREQAEAKRDELEDRAGGW